MAASMVRTKTPGIYRRGSRYVVVFRDTEGAQRKESARTFDEARRLKAAREADVARGEFHRQRQIRFSDFAREWVDSYQGKGRGFRERTRNDYRRDLERYAIPFLGGKHVTAIRRSDIQAWIKWLADDRISAARHRQGTPP